MKKIKSVKQAFELENLDVNEITISGVPERHVEALKSLAKLFVVIDQVNPKFKPDFLNWDQDKFSAFFCMGSPSGVGFSYYDYGDWFTYSLVGARLVSESREATKYIAEHPEFSELYKAFMVYDREIK